MALRKLERSGSPSHQRMREELAPVLSLDRCPITCEDGKVRIHTYAGGRINATIAAILQDSGVTEVRGFGDLDIELKSPAGHASDLQSIRDALLKLRDADARLTQSELAHLVSDRQRGKLAKFQPYLPPNLEGTYLSGKLFDVKGVSNLAREAGFEAI